MTVLGDATFEPNEAFTITLSALVNATPARDTAVRTILNHDLTTISVTDYHRRSCRSWATR